MSLKKWPSFVVACDKCGKETEMELYDVAAGEAYCTPDNVLVEVGWRDEAGSDEDMCPTCREDEKSRADANAAKTKAKRSSAKSKKK